MRLVCFSRFFRPGHFRSDKFEKPVRLASRGAALLAAVASAEEGKSLAPPLIPPHRPTIRSAPTGGPLMGDIGSFLLLSAAAFAGGFVSGLAGFAFSAVAGGILLHVLKPIEAVPLMMACSVGVQATNLWALRSSIQWRESSFLVSGGLIGVLTSMPGALPSIWCDMHGVPKNQQRGLVQPFIAAMQVFALALMLIRNALSSKVFFDLALSIPALLAGTALGIFAFRYVNDSTFRRIVLVVLLLSGLMLVA